MAITLIEALNYRCLRYVSRPLEGFHVLVGPNASGKTTFLDVVAFLGRLVSDGVGEAVGERTSNFQDLVWERKLGDFELAVEARIPDRLRAEIRPEFDTIRYAVRMGVDPDTAEIVIKQERGDLRAARTHVVEHRSLFPEIEDAPETLIPNRLPGKSRRVFTKKAGGNDSFYSEVHEDSGKGWVPTFRLGPRKSTLGNLPADESRFPTAVWLKSLLSDGVQKLVLNSLRIRAASPPGQPRRFQTDGSNLPWVIHQLENKSPDRFAAWIAHLRTAFPDLVGARTIERPDDKHRYLVLRYEGGLEVPSWMASDGTLRLLALTLPAYLPEFTGVYLIEEPENGIHPRAVETMFQSLSSVYEAQILLATHSPIIVSMAEPRQVLCFAKDACGATDIVRGSEHPRLKAWRGEAALGTLFASGILG